MDIQSAWQDRQQRLAGVNYWDMKGRMAVRTADDGGSATFIWERQDDVHHIEMFGPFGSGRVTIEQDPSGAVMREGEKPAVFAQNAEALLYSQVGWHVPFDSLKFWLKGIPTPMRHEGLVLDEMGRALGFQQDGWDISILDYNRGEPVDLPRKVFLKARPGTVHLIGEDGEDLGDKLEVKVVLKRWLAQSRPAGQT